jgi:H+-transporting ATPase
MPIMIWAAIIVEVVKAALTDGEGIEDVIVLLILQFANAIIGYLEEKNAGDAIAALKAKLAPMAHVCRDGTWRHMAARDLVPGDLIELTIGNIVPADAILRDCKPCQIDQAALTGESLPVIKASWEKLLMGSAVKQGEAHAVVVATGGNTFFGQAATLISSVVSHGRLEKTLFSITTALLGLSTVFCAIIFGFLYPVIDQRSLLSVVESNKVVIATLSIVIVILIASIPVAIEVVCTSTMAVGSHLLSEKGIIVARLSAIEELAGMTCLCSDKTGTLTKNKLELQIPIVLADSPPCDVVLYAALASKRHVGNQDAIDFAICDAKSNIGLLDEALAVRGHKLEQYIELDFEPFNPTDKRTLARVQTPDGTEIEILKGAPTVVLRMSHNSKDIDKVVRGYVQDLADRGFRALGVAINLNPPSNPVKKWEYLGILSIYDPPRDDTKATIEAAIANGIMVKMVTGDHGAIAKETCRVLGMGDNILTTTLLDDTRLSEAELDAIILSCDGFAEVMPEHKFRIVERIRQNKHVTGMTGDGVNDAPALKRADVGIAVAGATDAARAAADLVLTEEGLGVIIDAIFESRCIFQRMRNYIIYRIACTVQLLFFFFFAILTIAPDQ